MSMTNVKHYNVQRKIRAIIAIALVFGTILGLVGGATLSAFAASYNVNTLWMDGEITKVTDLDSSLSKCAVDIGAYINMPEAEVAIPLDLSKKGAGTIQMRWYNTRNVTDTFNVYLVAEEDLYTAVNLSGVATFTYAAASQSSRVQGLKRLDNGVYTWNLPVDGRQNYYLVVENTRMPVNMPEGQTYIPSYGYGDITLEFVYKPANFTTPADYYISPKTIYRDFISLNSPDVKYYVKAEASSLATLYFTFDGEANKGTGSGSVNIYNSYNELVATKQVQAYDANSRTEFSLALDTEEGQTYTVVMSGIQGATTLRMDTSSANVELSQENTDIVSSDLVHVNTNGITVSSIQYIDKDVPETLLENGSSWVGVKTVNDSKFEVSKNGTYTVRVLGTNGKYYYNKIVVNNIDNSVPDFGDTPSYKNGAIRITVEDDMLAYITLDGRKCLNGATINEEGMHNIQAADLAGNVVSMVACVDRTAPYLRNTQVYDGASLTPGYYSFDVVDDLAGIDFVMIDGVRQMGYNNKYSVTVSGSHEILIVDLCGNQTIIRVKAATTSSTSGNNNSGYSGGNTGSYSGGNNNSGNNDYYTGGIN